MKKLTLKYVDTLSRAETDVLQHMSPTPSNPVRQQLDADLVRLNVLKNLVLRIMYEPGLPLTNLDLDMELPIGPANNDTNPTP